MKWLKHILGYFFCCLIFFSCGKEPLSSKLVFSPPPPPPPPAPVDTLGNREFILPGLTWEIGYDPFMDDQQVYVVTPARPDLFGASRQREIYFQFDSSAVRVPVQSNYQCCMSTEYFWYYIQYSSAQLHILSNLVNYQLVGRRGSIVVKFL